MRKYHSVSSKLFITHFCLLSFIFQNLAFIVPLYFSYCFIFYSSLNFYIGIGLAAEWVNKVSAAAAKSLQLCPTLCDPIGGSPPGSAVPGILQARTLEWVAISFSKIKSLFLRIYNLIKTALMRVNMWKKMPNDVVISSGQTSEACWSLIVVYTFTVEA